MSPVFSSWEIVAILKEKSKNPCYHWFGPINMVLPTNIRPSGVLIHD